MVALAVLVAAGGSRRSDAALPGAVAAAARSAKEVVLVVGEGFSPGSLPDGVTAIVDEASEPSEASALRAVVDYAQRAGVDELLVALPDALAPARGGLDPASWARLATARTGPVVLATRSGRPVGLIRLEAVAWPLLPFDGGLARFFAAHPELVAELDLAEPSPAESSRPVEADDVASVTALLGRSPAGGFSVAVRARDGTPVVISNAPFLDDGTPMPTRYWLVGRREQELVGRLESAGGVRRAEQAIDPNDLAAAHARYAAERDATIPAGFDGPRPSGGVGGTRSGVKCLHAHLAWYLAGGSDPVGRWVANELGSELDGPVAAIDCGTNSTRLLVLERDGAVLERRMIVTRLGEGVDDTGELAEAAIERTLAALRDYRARLDHFGVVRVRAAATSAARDAKNAESFFSAAEAVLGVRPELLSGIEEGGLSYRGATFELDAAVGPFLVVDLGGGSTEFVAGSEVGAENPPEAIVSLDIGCVRVTERYLKGDPPTEDSVAAARSAVRSVLDGALADHPALSAPKTMVGVAGTISTLVALEIGLDRYDSARVHLGRISRAAVERWLATLAAETVDERRRRGAIEPGRADVIVGGAVVLAESMARLGHDELVHSERDILDGMAAELAAR